MKIDDVYFETILFYKICTDEIYLASIIDNLKPEYFKNSDIRNLIGITTDFYEKRGKSPSLTEIKTYLIDENLKKSFKAVINSFAGIDKNLDKEELFHNTETFLKERAVLATLMEAIKDYEANDIDSSKMLLNFEKACSINLHNEAGLDLFNNVDLVIKHLKESKEYIKTKWNWLDDKLGGGLLKNGRSLYIFAGETNIGKSIFLGNLADNIASQGKTVLLITLEMPEVLYAQRIYTKTTKIPISQLHTELESLEHLIKEYKTQTPDARILVKEFPPSTVTVNHIKAYIKKVIASGIHIDAIVIDYINLIACTIGSNSYERIKYVTEQVRALSYVFSCPIISATQLGRAAFGQSDPGLETVSESIGLAATADVICGISQDEADKEMNIISLSMMKNRFGRRDCIQKMKIDYSTLTINEDKHFNDTEMGTSTEKLLKVLSS